MSTVPSDVVVRFLSTLSAKSLRWERVPEMGDDLWAVVLPDAGGWITVDLRKRIACLGCVKPQRGTSGMIVGLPTCGYRWPERFAEAIARKAVEREG